MIPTACMIQAANVYHVAVSAIESVIEAPHPAGAIGIMGIPPEWLQTLGRFGFDPASVVDNDCENVRAGAWIMATNRQARVESSPPPGRPSDPPVAAVALPACAIEGAGAYKVPLDGVYRVLQRHQAGSGAGPMGVPLAWLPTLAHYGFNPYLVQHDTCMGYIAGEWILGLEQMQSSSTAATNYPVNIDADLVPPAWVFPIAAAAAAQYQIPEALLLAIAAQESGFHTNLTSPAGAQGLMQLMPQTASMNGVANSFDPRESMFGAAKYLSGLTTEFGGSLALIVAAYNAGDMAVISYGHAIPPYAETERYVPDVLARFRYYSRELATGDWKPFPPFAVSLGQLQAEDQHPESGELAVASRGSLSVHMGHVSFGP